LAEKNQLIELIYDDELVQQGELLFESNAVSDVSVLDSNLYVCQVKDGLNYEVEIFGPFLKKQKLSCECTFFKNNRVCKHVIAALFKIRENFKEKEKTKEVVAIDTPLKKQKLATLNINQILEEIEHEDLKSFVKNYAKQDKKFSTQLKVSFARKIDLSNNQDKYKNILNTIIRPYTGLQAKSNASELRAIIHVLENFGDQINDCIALGQYREAFNIYESAFAKLEYVRHYHQYHADQTLKLSHSYHQMIVDFLGEKLPPELRVEFIAFLIDLVGRSYYHFSDVHHNIIYLLSKTNKPKDNDKIKVILPDLISKKSGEEQIILLALYLKMEGKFSKNQQLFIQPYQGNILDIVDQLLTIHEEAIALSILENKQNGKRFEKDVANRLIFLYVRFNLKDKLIQTAYQAYVITGDLKYIDILKRELDEMQYHEALVNIENDLRDKKSDPLFLIRLYKREERWVELLNYFEEIGDLELLMQHDLSIYKAERTGLVTIYQQFISNYLDEHLGDIAFEYIENLKNHFKQQSMDGMLPPIQRMFKEKYPQRPKLAEIFN